MSPPEPESGYVLAGEPATEQVYVRSDSDLSPGDVCRWYEVCGHDVAGLPWIDVVAPHMADPATGVETRRMRPVTQLYTQDQLDAAVAAAQVTPVGGHLKEPGGYCRTCGHAHSHTEWARLHDQATEEDGDG